MTSSHSCDDNIRDTNDTTLHMFDIDPMLDDYGIEIAKKIMGIIEYPNTR